jgi:hypothetical protein
MLMSVTPDVEIMQRELLPVMFRSPDGRAPMSDYHS